MCQTLCRNIAMNKTGKIICSHVLVVELEKLYVRGQWVALKTTRSKMEWGMAAIGLQF